MWYNERENIWNEAVMTNSKASTQQSHSSDNHHRMSSLMLCNVGNLCSLNTNSFDLNLSQFNENKID
jgi:hypothetical protein